MPDLCLTLSEEEKYPELEGQTPDGGARQRGTPTFTLDLGGWKQARTPASTWSLVFLGTCQGWEADLNTFQWADDLRLRKVGSHALPASAGLSPGDSCVALPVVRGLPPA